MDPEQEYFRGGRCLCVATKREHQAFCYSCYSKLPEDLCNALAKRFGRGSPGAMERAADFLGLRFEFNLRFHVTPTNHTTPKGCEK
jgi:hypothetical protein